MAINTALLEFVSVDELLGPHAPALRIPDFQRPYSWTPRIAAQLFTDIDDALNNRPEHLLPVARCGSFSPRRRERNRWRVSRRC